MRRALTGLLVLFVAGCGGTPRKIAIPESVVSSKSGRGKDTRRTIPPYVIKMSDGRNTWQIEIPANQSTGGFQVMVPLHPPEAGGTAGQTLPETPADREIRQAQKGAGEPTTDAAANVGRSYLGSLARVNQLFRSRQYELAMIELAALEREYPDDARILEMKGTLYWRLRKPKLAREAWERVLALDPNNQAVAQALENLLSE